MRGKLYRAAGIAEKYRITPADAGKTLATSAVKNYAKDHPRGCGENLAVLNEMSVDERITPADAGKTRRDSVSDIYT